MKNIFFLVLSILSLNATALEGGGNIHLLHSESISSATAEYFWSHGKFSGFGFIDIFKDGDLEYLTDNTIDFVPSNKTSFFLSGEVGKTNFGTFQKAGIGINLTQTPFLEDILTPYFVFIKATKYKAWDSDNQTKIAWLTKNKNFGNYSVYLSGFMRLKHSAPDVIQPQIWISHESIPDLEIGLEYDIFGDADTLQVGIKYKF